MFSTSKGKHGSGREGRPTSRGTWNVAAPAARCPCYVPPEPSCHGCIFHPPCRRSRKSGRVASPNRSTITSSGTTPSSHKRQVSLHQVVRVTLDVQGLQWVLGISVGLGLASPLHDEVIKLPRAHVRLGFQPLGLLTSSSSANKW